VLNKYFIFILFFFFFLKKKGAGFTKKQEKMDIRAVEVSNRNQSREKKTESSYNSI